MEKRVKPYANLHVHTNRSDGARTIEEVVARADREGTTVVAITDHDVLPPTDLHRYEAVAEGRVKLIRGVEISCSDTTEDDSKIFTNHILALFCREHTPNIQRILDRNKKVDRSIKNRQVLKKLEACGKGIGTLEEIRARHPDEYMGKAVFAWEMVNQGKVADVDEAYGILSPRGSGEAYVPDTLPYASTEEVMEAIYLDGALPVSAHLDWMGTLTEQEKIDFVRKVARIANGRPIGMEVYINRYDRRRCARLLVIAMENGMIPVVASDFHGNSATDTLEPHFPHDTYQWYCDFEKAHEEFCASLLCEEEEMEVNEDGA